MYNLLTQINYVLYSMNMCFCLSYFVFLLNYSQVRVMKLILKLYFQYHSMDNKTHVKQVRISIFSIFNIFIFNASLSFWLSRSLVVIFHKEKVFCTYIIMLWFKWNLSFLSCSWKKKQKIIFRQSLEEKKFTIMNAMLTH